MNFGLTSRQYTLIAKSFLRFPEIEKVIVFGSRAMGNWKPASDVDLMLVGQGVTGATIGHLYGILSEDLPLPFHFDLLNANDSLDRSIREHIQQHGMVFWPLSP